MVCQWSRVLDWAPRSITRTRGCHITSAILKAPDKRTHRIRWTSNPRNLSIGRTTAIQSAKEMPFATNSRYDKLSAIGLIVSSITLRLFLIISKKKVYDIHRRFLITQRRFSITFAYYRLKSNDEDCHRVIRLIWLQLPFCVVRSTWKKSLKAASYAQRE